jgi:hypothetical protein
VTVDVALRGSSELFEEGDETDVPIFICGDGDFHFWIYHQFAQATCTATAFGYDQPRFAWQVNGVAVPTSGGTLAVPVIATFPHLKSKTEESCSAGLAATVSGNTLVLAADPKDGNYRTRSWPRTSMQCSRSSRRDR